MRTDKLWWLTEKYSRREYTSGGKGKALCVYMLTECGGWGVNLGVCEHTLYAFDSTGVRFFDFLDSCDFDIIKTLDK